MKPLTPAERRALRARAHHLDPVVAVGQHGLTAPVLHEIDVALLKHELVKVRVFGDDRKAREAILGEICAGMDCAPVQHVGKVLVLWRANPELSKAAAAKAVAAVRTTTGARRVAVKKTGPRTPVDPVRERRRARTDPDAAPSGKGRRGAARHIVPEFGMPPAAEPPVARRKSTFTPKTTPKSFSAKPNPRSAWEKKPPAGNITQGRAAKPRPAARGSAPPAAGGTRRRRTGAT